MTRALSPRALRSLLAHESGDAFLMLATFTDPTNAGTIYRIVNNTEDIVSDAHTFTACAFTFAFPPDDDDAPKGVQIQIDNVDQMLIGMLRRVTKPIPCALQVVVAATPDLVEMELPYLQVVEVEWNASVVTGRLASDDPLNQRYPSHIYEPRTFPGMF